ncbi:class I SAM-dependent methyltransferase [Conexibacter woesei]|uniref:Methyltransferase type 12 n=1 Tax=Conexibacter woesei (strain DSM 14684 / CCUG 47730 / CIP 108061 / JCM 11494 / NBRC 100937 / ID131577) TaxID=469383 RepID=D3FEI9_CONWI|nr:class I SAM-dependent methyltransferase [Conexibacter woesei]ADB49663.1 Methyltransferase type 12 [Conexibacter woesei DSM 14684]
MPDQQHELNRASWNTATSRHLTHKRDLAARLRDGESNLFPEEVELLGDVRGKRVVHLQCNDGTDTLGIAALGADALGVDISDVAVEAARRLSEDGGIAARFERADVLDWLPAAAARGERFDVVFASYGALCWISDLPAWMRGAAGVLAPGGRLVVVEFHPLVSTLEEGWKLDHPYFGRPGGQTWQEGIEDYVGYTAGDAASRSWTNPDVCVEFQHSLGDVLSAALGAGLLIEHFDEHRHCNGWQPFPDMTGDEQRRFHPPTGKELPMMFSLAARKPA